MCIVVYAILYMHTHTIHTRTQIHIYLCLYTYAFTLYTTLHILSCTHRIYTVYIQIGPDVSAGTRQLINTITFAQNCIIITKKNTYDDNMYSNRKYRFEQNL